MSVMAPSPPSEAPCARVFQKTFPLRLIATLDNMAATSSCPLNGVFESVPRIVLTHLEVTEISSTFPIDMTLNVSFAATAVAIPAHAAPAASWTHALCLMDPARAGRLGPVPAIRAAAQKDLDAVADTYVEPAQYAFYRSDVHRSFITPHASDDTRVLVSTDHPYYDALWKVAAMACSDADFATASDALCMRTQRAWCAPAACVHAASERLQDAAVALGEAVDLTGATLGMHRMDGREWDADVDEHGDVRTDTQYKCTVALVVRGLVCNTIALEYAPLQK